jgi:MFS family permease
VGVLGAVEFVAMMSTALLGGALADAVDRRRMMMLTELGLLATTVGLLANSLLAEPSVPALYLLAGLGMACYCLQRPSLDALLPRLVPQEQLVAAGALTMFRTTVGMIGGPAVGGLLVAALGLTATYAVDAATFVVSLALLLRMRAVPPPPGAERPSAAGVVEGWRFARRKPELLGTYLVDMNAMFFGMPNALFPAMAASWGGPSALGLLYAAPAVGALLASVVSGWAARVRRQGLAVLWAAGLWGVAIIGFGLAPWLWLALVLLALAGAADAVSGLFRMTIWNTTVPDHLRGRLAGIELVSYSSGPTLGNVEAGAVAAVTSPRFSASLGGVLCVAGTLVIGALMPAFRRYEAPARSGQPEPHGPAGHVDMLEDHVDGRA